MEENRNRYNKIALISLLLYFVETTLDGTGRAVDFGFISIQMILFAFACLFTLYPLVKRFRATMLNPCVIAALVFGVAVAIWTYIGFAKDNNPTYIRQDLTSVMAFALLPGTIATVSSKKKRNTVLNVFFICVSLMAAAITALHIAKAFFPAAIDRFNAMADVRIGGTVGKSRAYFRTDIFLIPGICLGVMKLREKESIWLYLSEGIMIFAFLLSMTRSLWLGLVAALLVVLALNFRDFKYFLKYGLVSALIVGLIIAASSLCYGELTVIPSILGRNEDVTDLEEINYGAAAVEKSTETAEPKDTSEVPEEEQLLSGGDIKHIYGSDTLRSVINSRLVYNIKKHPLIGSGLGADLKLMVGGKAEYMYLDFLMKMGIIGFLTFLAAFFTPVVLCLKRILSELRTPNSTFRTPNFELRTSNCEPKLSTITSYLMAGYLGIAVTSYFNPFLTNPMGIMALSILAASVTIDNDKQKQKTT